MKKLVFLLVILWCFSAHAQTISASLEKAMDVLQNDEQFRHSIIGFTVAESSTGKIIFEKNGQVGLAPASCQKVITSASAFELLGIDHRYKTTVYLQGNITGNTFNGNIIIKGNGDPSGGSSRFAATKNDRLFEDILTDLRKKGIEKINGTILVGDQKNNSNNIPRGWIWEDIGNYYGAGAGIVNWNENQFDITLRAGDKTGDDVNIVKVNPDAGYKFDNQLSIGAKGSGDNAYIFPGLNGANAVISGTIPAGEKNFTISGAATSPEDFFIKNLTSFFQKKNFFQQHNIVVKNENELLLATYSSPPFDSLNYWFLKRSVNLYGEAFVKTIANEKLQIFSTVAGLSLIKKLWETNNIDSASLNILDGSGLSPANRITTQALVKVLLFAKTRPWFKYFYNALPVANGINMKDGYISGVRSYTGYVKSANGKEYTFALIVNNFSGSPSKAREKMWKTLDVMK